MNDFQGRGPDPGESPGLYGPGGDAARRLVHQAVFRWDGNRGRQGTGMKAVAHSCNPGRAEELGRELGPLLWTSGAAATRPSVVRALSRDGDVLLVQRWPTTDRGGRPSTVSHVLIGDGESLDITRCLALAYGGWRKQRWAEQASGQQNRVDCAKLDELAQRRQADMLELLPRVKHALTLVGAELLRDPTQRVSLLLGEETPDWGQVPLVYLGLVLLFGTWLDQPWTFVTCDAVDTHHLRLMSVPRWEPVSGGSGPLARVRGRRLQETRFEHWAASRLVEHLLAHPQAPPGVPQLVDELADGASLDWERRRARLQEILKPKRTVGTRATPSAERPADPRSERDPRPQRDPRLERERDQRERDQGLDQGLDQGWDEGWDQRRSRDPETDRGWEEEREHAAAHRALGPTAPTTSTTPNGQDAHALHRELRDHRRGDGDGSRSGILKADLRTRSDELLLHELRSGELSPDSLDLVLDELGRPDRVQARDLEMQHQLCAEALANGLYFTPQETGQEHASRKALVDRAADVFTWAVAPLARDDRYLSDMRELVHRMSRAPHPTWGNWLRQSILEPANSRPPDLLPHLWCQIVRDAMSRNDTPPPAPPPPGPALKPAAPPQSSAFTPYPPTVTARLSDLINKPSCLLGGLAVLAAVLVVLVAMLVM
ncbi:hypothetical protein [Streptomyces sp. NPDC059063]|uniref:hypothetical protein n=1 Tax=unclassified Streptomyces TaxID=2593676 RepID=UPI003699D2A8